jgi:beta-carotene 3-hydroxylase
MAAAIILTVITFFSMEIVAWLTHKYVMHGLLWSWHRDHHQKENQHTFIERNDGFFLVFAIPAIALFAVNYFTGAWWALSIAIGISIYGTTYFFVHDVFIHQRLKIFRNSNSSYFKAIRRAHKMHHKHLGKEDGECFGMLWVPLKYFRKEFKS